MHLSHPVCCNKIYLVYLLDHRGKLGCQILRNPHKIVFFIIGFDEEVQYKAPLYLLGYLQWYYL